MSYRPVNLASRPFVNARPVVRTTLLLWTVGGLLMLLNLALYGRSLVDMEDRSERLAEAERQIDEESALLTEARDSLIALDLADQNSEAEFLQRRFEERRFPWSRLFGQLAGVLPRDVRLFRVRPEGLEVKRSRRSRRGRVEEPASPRQTWLRMAGEAKSDAALIELIDALFASPAFGDPQLPGESREADSSIRFTLSTLYREGDLSSSPAEVLASEETAGAAVEEGQPQLAEGEAGSAEQGPEAARAGDGSTPTSSESSASTPSRRGGLTAPGTTDGAERSSARTTSRRGSRRAPATTPSRSDRSVAEVADEPQPLARNASTPGVPN